MNLPKKKCIGCDHFKPISAFEGSVYEGDIIRLSSKCFTCNDTAPVSHLAIAKQKYYAHVEALVLLGFGKRADICASEVTASLWVLPKDRIARKLIPQGILEPSDIEAAWYDARTARIRRRIARNAGVPRYKPRKAKRIKYAK